MSSPGYFMTELQDRDFRQLEEHGISVAEAERQLDLLRHPPAPRELVRPCLLDDGIVAFSDLLIVITNWT